MVLAAGNLGKFGFCLIENGDVWIGVLPKFEKVLIGFPCFRSVADQHARSGKAELRERIRALGGRNAKPDTIRESIGPGRNGVTVVSSSTLSRIPTTK